ncbi:MAG: hypothetical protein ACSHW1_20110, partial [Yoonia sp.]|uniref:hypothetical protein n=1 Tax=Yoonia sp. TaxID=2212373 RepID=UPI003EF94D64
LDWSNAEVALIHGGLQMDYEGQFYDLPLHFTGEVIEANGVRTPIDASVRVLSHCINGDCGYAGEGEVLTFLHAVNGELVMYAGPCQSYPRAPVPEAVALVQQCVDDGQCEGGWEY